jgi:hypothetical protein
MVARSSGSGGIVAIIIVVLVTGTIALSGWFIYRTVNRVTDNVMQGLNIPSFSMPSGFDPDPAARPSEGAQKAFVKSVRAQIPASSTMAQLPDTAIAQLGVAYCQADNVGIGLQFRDSLTQAGIGSPKEWRAFRKAADTKLC